MKKAIFILFSSVLLWACNDIDNCNSNSEQSFMVVRFFDIDDQSEKKVGFRISATNSTGPFGLSSDSLAVGLPLNPEDTTTTFLFDSDTTDYELQVRYNVQYSIFDPSCNPSILFEGLDTLRSTFDSTVVVGNVTDRQLMTNIEVYF